MKLNSRLLLAIILTMILSLPLMSQPTLVAPANSSTCVDTAVTFMWLIYPNTLGYTVKISTSPDMSNPMIEGVAGVESELNFQLPNHDQTYYWTVTAHLDENPPAESVSATWSFRTMKSAPRHVQPIAGNSCVTKSYQFKWRKYTNGTYTFQLSLNPAFSSLVEERTNLPDSNVVITLPTYNQKYFWRVNATVDGCATKFSIPDSFVTQREPATLTSPANNIHSVDKNAGLKLSWSASAAPTNYIMQVATDSTFASILTEYIGSQTYDSVYVGLYYNTNYYWRVRLDYNSCYTEWTSFRRFRTEYEVAQNLIPREDSMCVPLVSRLRWDAVDGAVTYRVQISERDDFSTLVIDSANININYMNFVFAKPETNYYWRVKAQDPYNTGKWSITSRLQTAITYPTRIAPANGTLKLAQTVTFKWTKPNQWTYDRLQVSDDSSFQTTVFDKKALPGDSITLKMPNQFAKYYWRVQSDMNLCLSTWSSTWSFNTVLLAPVLSYPSNNETGQSLAVTFEWKASEGATTYNFNLSSEPTFQNILVGRTGLPGTKVYVPNLVASTVYYWRVNAVNARGESEWSTTFKFTTAAQPLDVPVQIYPLSGEAKLPVNKVVLLWNSVTDATKYGVQIADNEDMNNPIIDLTDHPDTTYAFTGLNYGTSYFWRVKAKNDNTASGWSSVRGFSTVIQAPSDMPVLVKPDDKFDPAPTEMTFEWDDVARAENYEIEIARDLDFTTIYLKDTNVYNSYAYFSNIEFEQTFYWRVRAKNYSGKGPWSDTRSFTTLINSVDEQLAARYSAAVSPNPVDGIAVLSINLPKDMYLQIDILNAAGASMKRLIEQNTNAGIHSFDINSADLDNGAYFAVIRVGLQRFTVKFIVNK